MSDAHLEPPTPVVVPAVDPAVVPAAPAAVVVDPAVVPAAPAAAPAAVADPAADSAPGQPAPAAPRPRLNALAVAALILGVLMSPLAALFGHLAVGQIARSRGAERGLAIAWVAVGLGYLWLIGLIVIVGALWVSVAV